MIKMLNLFRQKRNSDSEYRTMMFRLVFSYTVFLMICLLLINYLFQNSRKNSEDEYWEQNKSVFQSSLSLLDNQFIIIDSYCRQLIQDTNFTSTVMMKNTEQPNFYINAFRSKRSLSAQLYSYPQLPIEDFYIYLKNYDHVLSVNKFDRADLYYLHKLKLKPEHLNEWHNTLSSSNSNEIFYIVPDQSNYSYLVDLSSLTYKTIPATACFLFHPEKLKEIFTALPLEQTGYLMITNELNEKILSFQDADEASPDLAIITALNYQGNYSRYRYQGEDLHVTRLTSSFNNWNYYLVQPISICETAFGTYSIAFTIFMMILFIISVFLILRLSRRHMKPVLNLSDRLHETITAHNQLQEMVDFQKPYICASYLRHLLLGNVNSRQEIQYIQNYLQIEGGNLSFLVFYVVYYNTNDSWPQYPEEEMSEIVKQSLLNEFSDYAIPHLFNPDDRSYSLLLYSDASSDQMLLTLQEIFIRLHHTLLERYSIWIFTGVSLTCRSLDHIWKAYQQAKDMVSYSSKNYIFLMYEMIERDSGAFYYPEDLSAKMVNFISNANQMQVAELFHLIQEENLEGRSLPATLLNFLLTDIRNTLIKIRFSMTDSDKKIESMLKKLDVQFDKPLTFQLCETIALDLCGIFAMRNESNDLISRIIDYIRKNYSDPSLGLNKISDEFHISESYFSHMFKETTGINFSVYLEDIRLTEAIRLMKQTTANISELYLQVGYNSASTFRRAFKKRFGVTPSTMKNTP